MGYFKLNSIKSKLIVGYSVVAVIVLLIILYSWTYWSKISDNKDKLTNVNKPSIDYLTKVREGVESNNLLLFQYISGSFSSASDQMNKSYASLDSTMTSFDSLAVRFESVERRNLYNRYSEGYEELKQIQKDITSSDISAGTEQESIDITNYPGISGDTLILGSEFLDWYASQNLGATDSNPALEKFKSDLVPEWGKFEILMDKLFLSLNEEILQEEERLQSGFGKYMVTGILILTLLLGIALYLFHTFITKIINSISTVEQHLEVLSRGDIPEDLSTSEDEFAKVNHGLKELSTNLLNVKKFAQEVGNGNFDHDIDVFGNEGDIGKSLADVKDRLKNISDEDRKRNWSNQGFAQFGDILRNNADDLNRLTEDLIINLVKYLNANQGGIFILNEDDPDDLKMVLTGCYAYDRKKKVNKEIRPGQGLVGQCWQEKESIYLVEVPQEFINIRSGLGDSSPDCIFIVPLKVNEEVYGVIELASFQELEEFEREFVETLSESVASSISTVKTNANTKTLLEESQQMTEEMRAQEEEMRQNMEELQATQEEMQRNSREINDKEANLNALINNTNDSIITINTDYEVLVLNDQVRERYIGTQYEGIDVGFNVLEMLGDVREEWKGYYDRAFSGERLNFTIKSSVAGENTFREYFINPIKDQSGEIRGASVFSRDVTERENEKINSDNKSAFLDLVEELTKLTANVDSKEEIFSTCLKEICVHMDWPIGHVYFPSDDDGTLHPSDLWYLESEKGNSFKEATKEYSFKKGEGLPGRIWETKTSNWIEDVTGDPNFPRLEAALEIGLKGAFGFPVDIKGHVIAVLEFYAYHTDKPDEEVLKLVKHVGTQMGIFIERLDLLNMDTNEGVTKVSDEKTRKAVQDILKEEEELKRKMKAKGDKLKGDD